MAPTAGINADLPPHAAGVLRRVLGADGPNLLLTDDASLGKGSTLSSLVNALQRNGPQRVLLVVPPGLTRQWREVLAEHAPSRVLYALEPARIDELERAPGDLVLIAATDLLGRDWVLEALERGGRWDLVVFDEAHRLVSSWGGDAAASDRLRLADRLRDQADGVLLLSAVPCTDEGRAEALRSLLQPGGSDLRQPLSLGAALVRTPKADAVDAAGEPVFKGMRARTLAVPPSPAEAAFGERVRRYLELGYRAGRAQGLQGLVVMDALTTFRKLAASSLTALEQGLDHRRLALSGEGWIAGTDPDGDARYVEGDEAAGTPTEAFFVGEPELLGALADKARELLEGDTKLWGFLEDLERNVLGTNRAEKVAVFTEYRSTQAHVAAGLAAHFGADRVSCIHGGMSLADKRTAVAAFREGGQFVVLTEAGDGLELREDCCVLVNYDLPWDPRRMLHRLDRLYRYGQSKPVEVVDVTIAGAPDDLLLGGVYRRLEQEALAFAGLPQGPGHAGQAFEAFGELAETLAVGDVLEGAPNVSPRRTTERLAGAFAAARRAVERQHEAFGVADPAADVPGL